MLGLTKSSHEIELVKKLDFSSLFQSDYRSPEPDGDCFGEINSLGNINSQKSCPFCRILSEVVASRHFDTKGKDSRHYNDPNAIYMEAQRADYALCGSVIQDREADGAIASCLHVKTGEKIFHDKIFCLETSPGSSRTLYNLPSCLGGQVNFEVLRKWLYNCSTNHSNACALSSIQVDDKSFQSRQRVIDVRSRQIVPANFAITKYAALTYVWGGVSYSTS